MKNSFPSLSFLCFLWLLPQLNQAQPQINNVLPLAASVELNAKFEVELDITGAFDNPYDYDQIEVWAEFMGPDSQLIKVDGFYMEDFLLNANGSLTPEGDGFKIRFAPLAEGSWTYQIFVKDSTGTSVLPPFPLSCKPRSSAENHGYLRTNSTNYLSFDDGEPFVLIGENICWQNGNAYLDYKKWLDKMKAKGGNYFRLWHAHWGLGIEWKDNWNNFKGLRQYKEINGRYQDWLYDYCAENGIYIMLALQHHGPVSTQVNPNWNDSPYNAANGGPCQNTWDFFKDSVAKSHTKNRFRYIVARWGYARSIMAWELFNEVEWTDDYETYQTEVMEWHAEMAAYLKIIDPYGHIVTTSFAKEENDPMVWANPDMDITQTHHYINTPNIERALVSSIRTYLDTYDKPTMNGEFGIGLSNTLSSVDPDGIHIHNGLWSSLFGGGMGTGMTWWWDIYIDPQDLYHHFEAIAKMSPNIPFVDGDMKPASARVLGASGDLVITPTQNWGLQGLDSIFINEDGSISPVSPGSHLSTFLYGSQWNTQFRSPPVFTVYFPSNGTFSIRTGGGSGTDPRLNVQLNGNQVLSQNAQINTTYTVPVNMGWNTLRVDNTGTDWINIASYEFSDLGSALDTYVLRSADSSVAAGWVFHAAYNHEEVENNGLPTPVDSAFLELKGFADSSYFVKWYDCLSGEIVAVDPVTVSDSVLTLSIPSILWDYAFIVDGEPIIISSLADPLEAGFQVFPNPANRGGVVHIDMGDILPQKAMIRTLDMSGRVLDQLQTTIGSSTSFSLQENLSPGYYWIQVEAESMTATRPILVR